MAVYSGVEFENFNKAYDEINFQLNEMKNGNISDYELDSARKYISTSIRTRMDSAGGIEDYYLDSAISGMLISPGEFAVLAEKVSKDDLIAIANSIVLDTVHCITAKGGAFIEG